MSHPARLLTVHEAAALFAMAPGTLDRRSCKRRIYALVPGMVRSVLKVRS